MRNRSLTAAGVIILLTCILEAVCIPEQTEISCEMLDQFYALWSESRYGQDPTLEKSAWIVRDSTGENEIQKWPMSRKWRREVWKGIIPDNVVAQAHTHPIKTDPRPSTKDRIFSQNVRTPLYTVSRKGIWLVMPDGTMRKIAGSNWHIDLYQEGCGGRRD